MIFSNLAGTTSNQFKVGADSNGQLISNNIYDIYWRAANPSTGEVNPNVKSLPENTDLNDYHTVSHYGQYYAEYDKCSTIINIPEDVNEEFSLVVSPMTGGWEGFVIQELLHKSGRRYERYYSFYSTPNWSAWKQMAFKSDVPIESGTFSFTPTYDRLVLSNPRAWYNRVGNMVFVYATSGFTLLDNNTPYITGSFQGLPYKYDNEYFGFGNCAIKYYPIDSTKVTCGFSCWTASSTGLGFRISINCTGTDSNGQYISTDYPFGMAMKANIQSFFQAGFWYKMAS